MNLVALQVFCLVSALAVPLPNQYFKTENVQLLSYKNENFGTGSHIYRFEQSDGTAQEQEGELRNEGSDDEFYAVKGSFTWVGPDGVRHTVTYVADENGYQPEVEEGPGAVPGCILASCLG